MARNVAIVHYNTPELTEAAILSLRKHGGQDYNVFIFDNSDKRPWTKKMKNVKVFNNRKGKFVNFDKELAKYPDREPKIGNGVGCEFGSDKHMMSVQSLWDLIPDGFLLMDSDILIRQNIDFMFMEDQCCCGHVCKCSGPEEIERLAPMLLYINVPMCKKGGARFFDPSRSWALNKGLGNPKNYWDTGAAFLDDIRRLKPQCHGKRIDIRPLMLHFGSGSWAKNDMSKQQAWLDANRELWDKPSAYKPKYSVLTYIFNNYEVVHEIQKKDPEAEYILVTDNPELKSKTWNVFYDGSLLNKSPFDKCYEVRFHPFRYVNTDTVVRIDGSIGIKDSLRPVVDTFKKENADRCMMIHPQRNTMQDEYDVWVRTRAYPLAQSAKCLMLMEHLGYDLGYKGLFQGCFEIQQKSEKNDLVNNLTFSLLKYLGVDGKIERLDQTVYSFVINHLFSDRLHIMPVSEDLITNSDLMTWFYHNSITPIPNDKSKIQPMMFNKPCEVVEFG